MSEAIGRLLGTTPCDCGRCRAVATERVTVTARLGEALLRELAGRPAVLFGDSRTLDACGHGLARDLAALGADVDTVDLAPDGSEPPADDATVAAVRERAARAGGAPVPVAVGSGTVNDVVKAAAQDLSRRYVAVATAPSMNGYTSSIAAITVGGLKSTLPAAAPVAVLASPRVLADCPARLAVAGLADLLSKPVSSADWRLSHLLWGEPYCPRPAGLAGEAVEKAVRVASRLRRGDAEARVALFEALVVSGISMTMAGTSSPASGGEHLISHFLDMTADRAPGGPRRPALHGEQVGVGTRVTGRLYAALLARERGTIDWERAAAAAPDVADVRARLESASVLSDRLKRKFLAESEAKLSRLGAGRVRVARIQERWDAVTADVRGGLAAAGRYANALREAGAPATARDLGVAPQELIDAVRLARWSRDRYTILDLVDDLGLARDLEATALEGII